MKVIALLLALLMLLCCAGCGEKKEAGQDTTAAVSGQEEASQPIEELENICPEADDGKHKYEETVISEPTCVEPGAMMCTCTVCNQSITKEIPAQGHQGTGASCDEPSICTVCGGVAEEAWGHENDGGVCKNCGTSMEEIEARPEPTFPEVTEPEETEGEEVDTTDAAEAETEQ